MGRFLLLGVLAVVLLGCTCALDAEDTLEEETRTLETEDELDNAMEKFDMEGLRLLSRNKPASQSSSYTHVGHVVTASKANDGVYNQIFGTEPSQFCSHTLGELHPWWRVDLQGLFPIKVLKIWNRVDCCSNRLFPFKVETSRDGDNWKTCAEVSDGAGRGSNFYVPCKATARYVRVVITKKTSEYLTLCEVEVWGGDRIEQSGNQCKVVEQLLSRNKPAKQSSSYVHLGHVVSAQRANDGYYSQNFGSTPETFCSHTQSEVHPWWQVDLGSQYDLTRVKIWNRADCCSERLLPLKVETSADGVDWKTCAEKDGGRINGEIYNIPCEAKGRYVRVTITKPQAEYLTICEIEVWGGRRECCPAGEKLLSLNKPAEQSSSYVHLGHVVSAQRANDGYYSQNFGSTPETFCSHTKAEVHPWWRVDLGAVNHLTRVKIWNRADCCGDRLLPLKVETSLDGNTWETCGEQGGQGVNGGIYMIPCDARGRYVRVTIMKPTPEYLTICEIEVWGRNNQQSCCAGGGRVLSRNKPAQQSSTYVHLGHQALAVRGNDGNYNQVFGSTPDQFCTHTNAQVNPWWQVDLQGTYTINRVKIWNRADCCGSRLTPLMVQTSLDNTNWERCGSLEEQGENGVVYTVPCAATARYVRVTGTKPTPEYLTICELEVWGCNKHDSGYYHHHNHHHHGGHNPHYLVSSWYSSGRGWISTYFTTAYVYSTVDDIQWDSSYIDTNSPPVTDFGSYTTGDVFGRVVSSVVTSVYTTHGEPGWVSSGETTWKQS